MDWGQERILVVQLVGGAETFLAGGTVARMIKEEAKVTVLSCVQSSEAAKRKSDRDRLYQSLITLGISDHRYLGAKTSRRNWDEQRDYYPDNEAEPEFASSAQYAGRKFLKFNRQHRKEIDSDLELVIKEVKPSAILLLQGFGNTQGAQLLENLVLAIAYDYGIPVHSNIEDPSQSRNEISKIDVSGQLGQRKAALSNYLSSIGAQKDSKLVAQARNSLKQNLEYFEYIYHPILVVPWLLRLVAIVAVFIIAAAVTLGGAIIHQSTFPFAGIQVPSGIIYSVAILFLVLLGIRYSNSLSPITRFAAFLGVIAALSYLVIFATPGQPFAIIANLSGWIWLGLTILVSAGTVFWPSRKYFRIF